MQTDFISTYFYFNLLYYIPSLICFVIDMKLYDYSVKLQIESREEIISIYKKIFWQVIKNVSFYSIPYIIVNINFINWKNRSINFDYFGLNILVELCIIFFFTDFLFYVLHRLFHCKCLYRFHKKHHKINKPVGMSALYMDPIDMYFSNMIPVSLPFTLLSSPIEICYIWTIISIVETITCSHNGYNSLSEFHDYHHKLFNVNYGTTGIWDKLFGSYFIG
jgi:sterol desaturase/sphingolipid hydroxylase (fatty acid hydroxylase superfamily)